MKYRTNHVRTSKKLYVATFAELMKSLDKLVEVCKPCEHSANTNKQPQPQ